MFRRTASRVALASAVALVVAGALATPAMADGGQVGAKQYFYGEFFGLTSATPPDVLRYPAPVRQTQVTRLLTSTWRRIRSSLRSCRPTVTRGTTAPRSTSTWSIP
jgi:hypothetical protein